MAHIQADRIRETTTTTGTGNLTLGGAVTGYRTFASVMSSADTCYYTIQMGAAWEVGLGTFTSPTTLARTTIYASSNAGAALNFAAGTKGVFMDAPASKWGLVGDGTAANPTLGFFNDADNGFYRIGTNNIGLSLGGVKQWDTSATATTIYGGQANSSSLSLVSTTGSAGTDFIDLLTGTAGATRALRCVTGGQLVKGHTASIAGGAAVSNAIQINGASGTLADCALQHWGTASTGASWNFLHSRGGGTPGTQGINVNGDQLGSLKFYGSDGAAYQICAQIQVAEDGVPSAGAMFGRILFSTNAGGTTVTARLVICNDGGINIGSSTTSPGAGVLNVAGTTDSTSITTGILTVGGGVGIVKSLWVGGTINPAVGTASLSPLTFQSGTNLTTPVAGAYEYDGKVFYSTPNAPNRAVNVTEHHISQTADYPLTDSNAAQKAFNSSTNGAITLPASTSYEFVAVYFISNVGTTSHTWSVLFGGTATFTSIDYLATVSASDAGNALTAASHFQALAATALVITPASTSATQYVIVVLRGIMRVNGAGTVIPQVKLSAATSGASKMLRNSHFRCWPIGTNSVATVGNWS